MEATLHSICGLEVDPRHAALRETEGGIGMVMERSEAVELSPQNAYIRRLQHQLAQRANLVSRSRGRQPYPRGWAPPRTRPGRGWGAPRSPPPTGPLPPGARPVPLPRPSTARRGLRGEVGRTLDQEAATMELAAKVLRDASTTAQSFTVTVDQSSRAVSSAADAITEVHSDLTALEAQLRSVSILGAAPLSSSADAVRRIAVS